MYFKFNCKNKKKYLQTNIKKTITDFQKYPHQPN